MLLRSNRGNSVERVCVLFVNVPVVWVTPEVSVGEYLNSLSLTISATIKVPLYPLSADALEFVELTTFVTMIWSPTPKLCGLSERIFANWSVLSKLAWEINLVFRSKA